MTDQPTTNKTAMVVVAHPDDAEFGMGGTIALWVDEGYDVVQVVITDGSRGSDDPTMSRDRLISLRKEEQLAAAKTLGVNTVVFLGYEDGTLVDDDALRRDLVRMIRVHKPVRLLCFDPTMRFAPPSYINHPDHIAGANAALAAVYPFARNRMSYRELLLEGLEPHTVPEVFVAASDKPDTWIDISSTIDRKIEALKQHGSQVELEKLDEMMREWARRDAQGKEMEFAETFRYFKLD